MIPTLWITVYLGIGLLVAKAIDEEVPGEFLTGTYVMVIALWPIMLILAAIEALRRHNNTEEERHGNGRNEK